ncbi:MAG TPA: hypothetical protein VFE78_31285, partial [Gemmataceae bacterium]|nr:hypothetical protein [Gemmataceae bacterium]
MSMAHSAARGARPLGAGARRAAFLVAGCLLLAGAAPAGAAPTVAQMLSIKPKQEGVAYATPTADEQAGCKVELAKADRGSGWLLKDKDGRLLRRFFDSNADNRIDVWSYFKDGTEVYRETDTTFSGKPDQYRWLNAGGSKWGTDEAKDGRIKSWKVISPEEVSQELLQALIARDVARFQVLLITEAELQQLGLPAEQAGRVRESLKAAPAKFQEAQTRMTKLTPKSNWIHVELGAPQCLPADQTGARADVIKYTHGTILYEVAGGNDWVQTGEIIQVGAVWRLTGAPVPGPASTDDGAAEGAKPMGSKIDSPELKRLIDELTVMDQRAPQGSADAGPDANLSQYHLARADKLEKIIALFKPAEVEDRDPFVRQLADSLSTAAQKSAGTDSVAFKRLAALEGDLAAKMRGSSLAAYVTYREIQADYYLRSSAKDANNDKVQQYYLDRLAKFVADYPKADDTPDVILQLGLTNEILNKDTEAKNWYGQLTKNFADKAQAAKAAGAVRRLELEGKPLELAGPLLKDANTAFDVASLRGKVVVVYYWWSGQAAASDFGKLKRLLETYAAKGVELVTVNLDGTAAEAQRFLANNPSAGTHLYEAGGLESKLA